jgi:hypothetical protein
MQQPIDMSNYKVIYKGIIYHCLTMAVVLKWDDDMNNTTPTMERALIMYIDENNRVASMEDDIKEFQFIAK